MLSILKASAGSGKTFALTKEYLKMLLGYKDGEGHYHLNHRALDRHRNILAITFTNKATDEMKQRIIHELAVLAGLEPLSKNGSPYTKELTALFGCSEAQLREQAGKALKQLLFDFGSFNVSTIDAFFQMILRAFAFEAELEGDYELEIDSGEAYSRAVDELLTSINSESDNPETKTMVGWITQYMLDRIRESGSATLFNRTSTEFNEIVKFINNLSDETFMSHYDEMMQYLSIEGIKTFKGAVDSAYKEIQMRIKLLATRALEAIEMNPLPGKGKYDHNVVNAVRQIATKGILPSKSVTAPNVASGNKAIANKEGMKSLDEKVEQAVVDACSCYVESQSDLNLLGAVRGRIFVLGLFQGVYKRIHAERAEKNVLLLGDTNDLLRRIIGDEDAPFVFERVGMLLHHFLIDEFQDTSKMQWHNLKHLLANSHSEGNDNLIIGDEKQCIYRFRSSDPTLLQKKVRAEMGEPVWPAIDPATGREECGMDTNWRSSADVINFNNNLFCEISKVCGVEDIYSNVNQKVSPPHSEHRGYVDICQIGASKMDEFVEPAMERMISHIKRQLASGYRPCDIVVLIRKNMHARHVVDYLLKAINDDESLASRNLRVVSDDAMSVNSSPAVRRIVAVLRSMATSSIVVDSKANEKDDDRYRTRRELINLINRYELCLGEGLTPSESLTAAVAQCGEDVVPPIDITKVNCASLPSLVERIVAHYFPDGTVPAEEMTHLLAFEDLVTDFCSTSSPDLQSFIRWWDTTGSSSTVSAAPDESAIRVMTIHQSKGLEFPCVHLPMLVDNLVKFKSDRWFECRQLPQVPIEVTPPLIPIKPEKWMLDTIYREDYERLYREQLLDEINVLYVAFTRAVDELIVTFRTRDTSRSHVGPGDILFNDSTIGELMAGVLADLGKEGPVDIWGSPTSHTVKESHRTKAIEPVTTIDMPAYSVDERDSLWSSTRVDTTVESMMGRERGIVLHDILAGVNTRADIFKAVSRAVRCGRLHRDRRDEVVDMLDKAISASPLSEGWFADDVRPMRERSIVLSNGDVLRPDRVVWHSDGSVDVVDYKFGEQISKRYNRQVLGYMSALGKMGHEKVRGYLWYVTLGKIVAVKPG